MAADTRRRERIAAHFRRHRELMEEVAAGLGEAIDAAAGVLARTLGAGGKILVMGNGGSAADAQHFAAELVGRFLRDRRPLPALALTADSAVLTSLGNDQGFACVFQRQVEALGRPGDAVIAISTSGRSGNILRGLEAARSQECRTLALLGGDGGAAATLAELALVVPAPETPLIQEAHAAIIHLLCELVETELFGDGEAGR